MHGWLSKAPMTFMMTLWPVMCCRILLAVLTLVITLTGHQPEARAATRTAASCSPTDVQNAINAAASGDTVTLPACNYTNWSTTVTITKAITLEGAGMGRTVLQRTIGGALTMFQVTGVTRFEMRNLTLDGTYDTNPSEYQDLGLGLTNAVDFKIHNTAFQNLSRGIELHGDPTVQRGVIYQNTFTDMYYRNSSGTALGYGVVVYGNGTWPALELGTAQNVFIENNTFTRNRHTVASNNGSRYVFRYNSIIDNREDAAAIDAHGKSSWPRGSRQYEVYNNTIKNSLARYAGVGPRGGDGVIFNNKFSSNITYEILLHNDGGCSSYPAPDQIRSLYIWSNTLIEGGNASIVVTSGCTSIIQLNRDYFLAQRSGYTPYTYPHPLTQTGSFVLSAPTNLRLIQ